MSILRGYRRITREKNDRNEIYTRFRPLSKPVRFSSIVTLSPPGNIIGRRLTSIRATIPFLLSQSFQVSSFEILLPREEESREEIKLEEKGRIQWNCASVRSRREAKEAKLVEGQMIQVVEAFWSGWDVQLQNPPPLHRPRNGSFRNPWTGK